MGSRWRRSLRSVAAFAVLAMLAAACDSGDTSSPTDTGTGTQTGGLSEPTDVQLILDFVPGGIHTGIYAAKEEGYFDEANINIDIQSPTSSADTLRLVMAGQSTVGIAPIADVANLRAQGEDIQIFLALDQVPLGALMSTEAIGITDPSQLAGKTIGVTGVPSDEAFTRVILENSGVDPDSVEFVNIGFDAVANLIGQSVDAAVGFWPAEAVVLELEGEKPVIFRPDEYGAPPYPELVFFASTETVEQHGDVLQAFSDALGKGYDFALNNTETAIGHLAANADGTDEEFATAEFENVRPYFLGPSGIFGEISDEAVGEYLSWAAEVGILESVPENLITTEFLPEAA